MKQIRKIALWAVWNIPLGRFAPHVLGFALNSKPMRCAVQTTDLIETVKERIADPKIVDVDIDDLVTIQTTEQTPEERNWEDEGGTV